MHEKKNLFLYLSAKYQMTKKFRIHMNYLSRSLFILVSLFAFSSCQKNDSIGLDIDPQDTIKSEYIENFNVQTVTVPEDSVLAYSQAQYPAGSLSDPVLGDTKAAMAMTLTLPSTALTFGSVPILDSAVLVLKYGRGFYGDSTNTTYTVNVHQLKERYISTSRYYTNRKWDYDSTATIGSLSNVRSFRWNDSISVSQIIKGAPDTLLKVQPQLRIKLNNEKIQALFLNSASANFATNTAFQNHIKGLYVTINKNQPADRGGIAFFDLATASVSGLELYYKSTSGTTTDTTKVVFALSNTTTSAAIKHNYTGTPVKTQLDNPTQSFSTVYTQPMAGLRTKIVLPDFAEIKALGKVAINKAELVVYVEEGSDAVFQTLPRLTLYRTDIAGQRQAADQVSFIGTPYDSVNKRYVFNISTYIQGLIGGKDTQYETYIAPVDVNFLSNQTANIGPVLTTAARSVLSGHNHTNPERKIKLNIYYTRPD